MSDSLPIKVMLIDDSAVVRNMLADILTESEEFEVIATASDPIIAASKLKSLIPDVIILDVEMPRMDGITFLKKLMKQHPLPVVICSSLASPGSTVFSKAMEYGAIDVITKPQSGTKDFIRESGIQIRDTIKAASLAKPQKLRKPTQKKLTADAILPPGKQPLPNLKTDKVIVVGASTGGTEALRLFLQHLPTSTPGIAIVQHMPEKFTTSFAQRLDSLCEMRVKEAATGDELTRGQILLAPGHSHMLLKRGSGKYYVELKEGPLVSRHRPSVDVLFRSAARYAGANAIGVLLTGMGADGAKGMLEMKEAGAYNFAQDEASSVVFGMPKEAIKLGGVDKIVALQHMPRELLKLLAVD
ncbi:chemotaxis response regulator protein-glutamate methylesterase [Aestuariibacter sp. AA17]|uniref:Protein-glutamate methylesterase/protein-glutamine glutaminase n=1 Tax=Fluctibacter corallii TaxID=2984329 RepID=A0ABT3A7S1_9ALTE|nr:chemotaxis response regulator protein-glutamate methylesterase [Aestuariibacter sp. AA17]MCV2884733.1 chemotaxis response regulator protein-glutamate methylesterase [Aestuariibacter sp. AA17]